MYRPNVEILAPAGNFECFKAAIGAGADAIYLGGNMFGARAFAGNFEEQELIKAIEYAHLRNKQIYLTVNTLLREDELDKLIPYIRPYYEAGLDAAIVQDYGVFSVLGDEFKDLELHASTQMTITGRYGAKLLKDMGASRIVTARELSLAEIKDIHDNVDIEIESFVHGALCYSYSGQCLLSSIIGGRSGNRGRCAQPCRLTYSSLGMKDKYLLSPKDMCTLDAICDIIDAGVYSLKIEGRMKSPEYVAGVVRAYRKYVDLYEEKGRENFKVDEKDVFELMDLYNRGGFCKGYYYKHNDKNMMTFNRPNHQGVMIGRIKNGNIVLSKDIYKGDVLELEKGVEFTASNDMKNGATLKIPAIKGYKPVNQREVYRTRNNYLLSRLNEEYVLNEKKLPIRMMVRLNVGEEAMVTTVSFDGTTAASVKGDVIEASMNRPATKDDIYKQLLKLGDTLFSCDKPDINIEMSENAFVPVKLLNNLRREAVAGLEKMLLEKYINDRKNIKKDIQEDTQKDIHKNRKLSAGNAFTKQGSNGISIQVMKREQLKAVLDFYNSIDEKMSNKFLPSSIYVSTELEGLSGALEMKKMLKGIDTEVYLCMPYIFRKKAEKLFDENLKSINEANFDGFLIRSPEHIEYLLEKRLVDSENRTKKIVADYNIYTYNTEAVKEYERLGIDSFTLSEELNENQLKRLCAKIKGEENVRLEKIVYGHLPLMITAGCTRSYLSKDKVCNNPGIYEITDRKNNTMQAINSCFYCYNMLLNVAPISLLDKLDNVKNLGVDFVKVIFTIEDTNTVGKVLDNLVNENNNLDIFTRGHFNRGVD